MRATKIEQSRYATEAIGIMSKHFCHLHGLLQVAELQVIEKLRESSLPPQIQLNEAMGKLRGYESVILVRIQILFWSSGIVQLFYLYSFRNSNKFWKAALTLLVMSPAMSTWRIF